MKWRVVIVQYLWMMYIINIITHFTDHTASHNKTWTKSNIELTSKKIYLWYKILKRHSTRDRFTVSTTSAEGLLWGPHAKLYFFKKSIYSRSKTRLSCFAASLFAASRLASIKELNNKLYNWSIDYIYTYLLFI